ncbi:MAG TPA: hypothetical protein VE172_13785 [Stackebrandtia sp.]|jgi:hypothetical protein|uniref:hypothetical protein n=1 Tax=Stackebrandtia sp. TaxID=2023065 RepID=UPI002D3E3BD6|nr:hypothetical protein [Stackebrandtia sp.]HZE39873.1 hypothetical protein [Stackebrandtia sp.]
MSTPWRHTLATLHLCAGTYLDEEYRRDILNEIYHQPDRAVAPYAAADAAEVLRHAKRARGIDILQNIAVILCELVFLAAAPLAALVTLAILVEWQWLASVSKLYTDGIRLLRGSANVSPQRLLARGMLLLLGTMTAVMAFLTAITFADVSTGLSAASALSDQLGLSALNFMLLAAIACAFAIIRRHNISEVPHTSATPDGGDGNLHRIHGGQFGDVVTYADDNPFIGSGSELRTWQFALPLRRADTPGVDDPEDPGFPHFDTVELTGHLKRELSRLAFPTPASYQLPDLHITDVAFIAGVETEGPVHRIAQLQRPDRRFTMDDVKRDPTTVLRHYLKCQVVAWDGEIVTTVYVHAALQGETLYMEFSSFALPPTRAEFHVFGDRTRVGGPAMALDAVRAFGHLPRIVGRAPINLARDCGDGLRALGHGSNTPRNPLAATDHGARVSVRELGTDLAAHNYFQRRDVVKYTRILERQVLRTSVDFLRGKHVDTFEVDRRANTIINNGLIGTNRGSLNAGSGNTFRIGQQGDDNTQYGGSA